MAALIALNHSTGFPPWLVAARRHGALIGLFVLAGATPAAVGFLSDVSEGYPGRRGVIMGLYSVFLALGQIIGAVVAGVAAEWRGIDGLLIASARARWSWPSFRSASSGRRSITCRATRWRPRRSGRIAVRRVASVS